MAVSSDGSIIYVAGGFNSSNGSPSIGGQARNYAAAVNAVDGTATGFNPNPNAIVNAFGVSGSAVYLAGYFSSLGGVVRHSIAAISAIDGTATGFDPNAAGFNGGIATVYALAVSGSTVYAGGYFGAIGGQPRASIAALSVADGSATSWDPSGHYFTGPAVVETLAVAGSTIYAGGVFTTIGGQTRNNIAALSAADGTATTWDPNPNSEVATLGVSGQLVYVGGLLHHHWWADAQQDRGAQRVRRHRHELGSGRDRRRQRPCLGHLRLDDLRGRQFPSIHGVPRQNIAGINASDGTPTGFDPQASDPSTGGGVHALAVSGSTVYAAGFFTSIGGQTRNLIAGLKASDGTATSFDPNGAPGFGAFALAVASDGTLYAGGSFDTFDLAYQQGFAQFSPILKLVGAVSRKTHGTLSPPGDLPLTAAGAATIECRSGRYPQAITPLIFSFLNTLNAVSSITATATTSSGSQSVTATGSISGNLYTVNLTGVPNASHLNVTLNGVTDSANNVGDISAHMDVLLGDVNSTGRTDAGDVTQVRNKTVSIPDTTDPASFRYDVNISGRIDAGDVTTTRNATVTVLP